MTKKLTQIYVDNPISSFDKSDLLILTNDTGVTPDSGASRYGDLLADILKGWIPSFDTWTYASASTFTISGDRTAIYTLGTKIKWTQTTVKYGIVVSSSYSAPNTTVIIAVNTDYVITNAAISANFYANLDKPVGFPSAFNYTPVWSGAVTNPVLSNGTMVASYAVRENWCRVNIQITMGTGTTYGSGAWMLSVPFTSNALNLTYFGNLMAYDQSVTTRYVRQQAFGSSQSVLRYSFLNATTAIEISSTVPFTWTTSDVLAIDIEYRI